MIKIKPTIEASTVFIQYNGSAALERPEHQGLSHLWEHLKCKTWFGNIKDFTRWGVSWNAFTSGTRVCYYMRGLNEGMKELIGKYVLGPKHNVITYVPTEAEFNQERKVVLQEYDNAFADPEQALYVNIGRRTSGFSNAIGIRSVLENVTYKSFLDFMQHSNVDGSTIYTTPSFIHFVGDPKVAEAFSINNAVDDKFKFFKEINAVKHATGDMELPIECSSYTNNKVLIGDYIQVPNYKSTLMDFLVALWSSGFDSPLVTELRHKRSLTYSPSMFTDEPTPNIYFYVTTSPENVATCRTVIRNMLADPSQFITQERFDHVKTSLINAYDLSTKDNTNVNYVTNACNPFELNTETIKGFDYEKCLKLMSGWADKIHHAQVGKEMVIE